MSFYLKYRPQKVNDLDLEGVRQFLERMLNSGSVAHAYLFTGPRGTGKTSAARILAKVVNCRQNLMTRPGLVKKLKEPCNKCVSCKAITEGVAVDLIEIDAASNRGIDDIRDLREKIRLSPASAHKKVYIIDEAHMLTLEAFNALLKTLEEPPKHALFVLATTEAHKIPETIASRCVRLVFEKADKDEVRRSLNKAVKGEKINIETQALDEIAKRVDGSFREGMKILEQLSLDKKKITLDKVQLELKRSGAVAVLTLLEQMRDKDMKKALAEIRRLNKAGVDFKVALGQVLELLRETLLVEVGVKSEGGVKGLSKREALTLVDLFLKVGSQMRQTEMVDLPWEIGVIEWCDTNAKLKIENEKLDKEKQGQSLKKRFLENKGVVRLEQIQSQWEKVLAAVRPHNHSLEGLLRSTRPVGISGNRVMVEVFYQFHLDQLSQPKFMQVVEGEVQKVFSSALKLEYHLGKRPIKKQVEAVENIAATNDEDIISVAEEIFGN